jgi:hypothetical protein
MIKTFRFTIVCNNVNKSVAMVLLEVTDDTVMEVAIWMLIRVLKRLPSNTKKVLKMSDTMELHLLHFQLVDHDVRQWFLTQNLVTDVGHIVFIHVPKTWSIRARKVISDLFGKAYTHQSQNFNMLQKAKALRGYTNVSKVQEPDKELINQWELKIYK